MKRSAEDPADQLPLVLYIPDLARALGRSEKAIKNAVYRGALPAPRRVAGRLAWTREDVLSFLAESHSASQQAKRQVKITARPHPRDKHRMQVTFNLPSTDGSRKRPRRTAPAGMDRAAAIAWGHRMLNDVLREHMATTPAREEPPPPESKPIPKTLDSTALTLAEFWLDDVESYLETLAPGSRKGWRQIWRDHIAPVLGELPLDAIRRPEVLKLRRKIKPLATATRNAIISKVRKLLDMAAELGHLAEAPRIASEKGLPCKETPAYTAEEIGLLVATARTLSPEHVALVLVMTDTCLRVSEVCALRWGDVDLARGLITVRHNFSGGEPWRPKGKKVKPVGITPDLEAALRDLPRRGSRDHVFVRDETGQRHTRSSIMWRMGQVQTRAGLPVWTPHKFRHSGVTAMADAGADVWTIMAQARHADMKTTLRYVHTRDEEMARRAAAVVAKRGTMATKWPPTATIPQNRPAELV
ncbi:tyrosine-type recombinase/integrase [Nannocystis pusilla]|uniref:tyrosine-type recombinase/integrase n=1 Tax=Nannocystis pusilla TaxID=889268 RepID=UPI003BF2E717